MVEPVIALKEWAVTVDALGEGQQIVVMRKGGIAEETKHFYVKSRSFYLFPTYEHQKEHLLKSEYHGSLRETLHTWNIEPNTVTISYFAEVMDDLEIKDQQSLLNIAPFHMWTESFAEERLRWKRQQPLHLLLLRIYVLDEPVRIPILPAYTGCKSWIQLEQDLTKIPRRPVLSDTSFDLQRETITSALLQEK